MDIRIIRDPVTREVLEELMKAYFRTFVKGVADIDRCIIALGGDWHMDANTVLLADGSKQEDLWGFNIYPDKTGGEAIEYDSLINIRPAQNNRTRELQDEGRRDAVRIVVAKFVPMLGL